MQRSSCRCTDTDVAQFGRTVVARVKQLCSGRTLAQRIERAAAAGFALGHCALALENRPFSLGCTLLLLSSLATLFFFFFVCLKFFFCRFGFAQSASDDCTIILWNYVLGQKLCRLEGHTHGVTVQMLFFFHWHFIHNSIVVGIADGQRNNVGIWFLR